MTQRRSEIMTAMQTSVAVMPLARIYMSAGRMLRRYLTCFHHYTVLSEGTQLRNEFSILDNEVKEEPVNPPRCYFWNSQTFLSECPKMSNRIKDLYGAHSYPSTNSSFYLNL